MSDFDLNKIRRLDGSLLLIFRELLRRRRATEAAQRLGLSSSAVSHALARLQAVTGRTKDALASQERLAHAFADIYADGDIAYPLSEWARLAGALRDAASLERAQAFHEQMLGAGSYRGLGPRYVELALIRGRLLVDPDDVSAREAAVSRCPYRKRGWR